MIRRLLALLAALAALTFSACPVAAQDALLHVGSGLFVASGGGGGTDTFDDVNVGSSQFYATVDATKLIVTSNAAGSGNGIATTINAASADGNYWCEATFTTDPTPYKSAFGVTNSKTIGGGGGLGSTGSSSTGYITDSSSGYVQKNGSTITTPGKSVIGDTVGELLNISGGVPTLTYYLNISGTWTAQTPIAAANLPTGPLYCAASVYAVSGGNKVTINLGASAYAIGTPPAGAANWP